MFLYFIQLIMRVAVTGASGHIGNCLVKELKKSGARIKILNSRFGNGIDSDVEIIDGNLSEPGSLDQLCEGVEIVFHLAAQIAIDNRSAARTYETNVNGTKNILNAAVNSGVKKFIHFSSIHAFRMESPEIQLDETSALVESNRIMYEYTKAEGEREVLKAVKGGLNAVILNPTAVIGPFDYRESLLGKALRKIYQNKLPFLVSGGYNWVDVRDVVSASIKAINRGGSGEKYILSGKFCSLKELSEMINRISGCRIPFFIPAKLARMVCPLFQIYSSITKKQPLYTSQSIDILVKSPINISNRKAREELGFEPRPLEETLTDSFNWYKENNFL